MMLHVFSFRNQFMASSIPLLNEKRLANFLQVENPAFSRQRETYSLTREETSTARIRGLVQQIVGHHGAK